MSNNYLIVDNTLYCHGVDSILRRCLTHEEAEVVLNDFHGGACGGHLSGLSTAQKIFRAHITCEHLERMAPLDRINTILKD